MAEALTADGFAKLLDRLDSNRDRAGDRYETLRRTLIRFFEWRGAPSEEHADETFNRVARKLEQGTTITNIGGYCYEVARLVCLESFKGRDSKRASLDATTAEAAATDSTDAAIDAERRMACLDDCLRALPRDGQDLVVEYYQADKRERIIRRRAMAERLGVRRDALANRAQRLRDNLERCVLTCLRKNAGDMKARMRSLK